MANIRKIVKNFLKNRIPWRITLQKMRKNVHFELDRGILIIYVKVELNPGHRPTKPTTNQKNNLHTCRF